MDDRAASALAAMADAFAAQGCHIQANKCLEAACRARIVPEVEIPLRLKLAALLLERADSAQEARAHVEKARSKLDRSHRPALHCHVLSELGRCQRYLGEVRLQKASYIAALELLQARQRAMERSEYLAWSAHFQLRLADAQTADGDPSGAKASIDAAASLLEGPATELQVQVQLAGLQHDLVSGDRQSAVTRIARCQALLQQLARRPGAGYSQPVTPEAAAGDGQGPTQPEHTSPLLRVQLRAHLLLLRALHELSEGDGRRYQQQVEPSRTSSSAPDDSKGGAATGSQASACAAVQEVDQAVDCATQGPWLYEWLPSEVVPVLWDVVVAQLLSPGCRWQEVTARLHRADQQLQALVQRNGLDIHAGEAYLSRHHNQQWRLLPVLQALVLEGWAALHLTRCALEEARGYLAQLHVLLGLCPITLGALVPGAHLLTGHYAWLCGNVVEAHLQYRSALMTTEGLPGSISMRAAAGLCLAATLLEAGGQDAVGQAAETLEACGAEEMTSPSMPSSARAYSLMSTGLVHQARQHDAESKVRLGKTLRLLHHMLCNHQPTTQVLVHLAPIQLERNDKQGAANMLKSAYTVARSVMDLASQVACLRTQAALEQQIGVSLGTLLPSTSLPRKEADLAARAQAARTTNAEQHASVVKWWLAATEQAP